MKIGAWKRFAQSFAEDNPYSIEDNTLRSKVSQRIRALQQAARREQQQAAQLASLSSASGGALSSRRKACDECPEMVLIPEGRYCVGLGGRVSGGACPVRSVLIKAFAMGKYDVPRDECQAYIAATDLMGQQGCQAYRDGKWHDDAAIV